MGYTKKDLEKAFNAARKQIPALSGPPGFKYWTFKDYFNKTFTKKV